MIAAPTQRRATLSISSRLQPYSSRQLSSACWIKEDLRLISESLDLIDDRPFDLDAGRIQSDVPRRADENSAIHAHVSFSY
jgi:hypothetical protein